MSKRRWPVFVLSGAALSVVGGNVPASAAAVPLTEHILVVETSLTAASYPVSATGPIHALGKDLVLSNNKDTFVFPKGNLDISHERTSGSQSFDKTTCTGKVTEKGIYHVTGGTKAYAHASGKGTYSAVGYIIGCNPNKPPTTVSFVIQAAGPLHLSG